MTRTLARIARASAAAAVAVGATLAPHAAAGGPVTLNRELVAGGMTRPLFVTHAPGDFDRIFIVEQPGRIRVFDLNTNTLSIFLDIQNIVRDTGNEQGLLGLAFHPDYANNGYFYVNYTAVSPTGATKISRFSVNPNNPNLALTNSEVNYLQVSQPFSNHNGGWIGFSPNDDGNYLYIASGDGGSGNDPQGNAQNRFSRLGKMLRIDVDASSAGNPIPAPGNPFNLTSGDALIWHYGLRNPWRSSFDRETGDLLIGDVGQNAREEVSVQVSNPTGAGPGDPGYGGGKNYGWRCMEGFNCTGLSGCTCNSPGLTLPVHAYTTGAGGTCSVVGGYVYRGCAIPELVGTYFFGDYCSGDVWTADVDVTGNDLNNLVSRKAQLSMPLFNLVSFGEDAFGELYMAFLGSGQVWKIVPAAGYEIEDCDEDGVPDACAILAGDVADSNGNGIPDSCEEIPCPGDLDGNLIVDSDDLGVLLSAFGTGPEGDLDDDGDTDSDDLGILLSAFGSSC
ncbi:MAG: PQQ-dependent sugar dehydrogenase [Phycisphaerales bacterium]